MSLIMFTYLTLSCGLGTFWWTIFGIGVTLNSTIPSHIKQMMISLCFGWYDGRHHHLGSFSLKNLHYQICIWLVHVGACHSLSLHKELELGLEAKSSRKHQILCLAYPSKATSFIWSFLLQLWLGRGEHCSSPKRLYPIQANLGSPWPGQIFNLLLRGCGKLVQKLASKATWYSLCLCLLVYMEGS